MYKVTRTIQPCLKAAIFGAFHLFFFDRCQPICIKDQVKIPQKFLALRSKISKRADLRSIKAQNAANAPALASILTKGEQKSAFLKQGSDHSCHLKNMRVRFCKEGSAIYFSHLDLNRVVLRALRRSGIPYWSKGGFSPHPYCVFAQSLSLGFESEGELFDFRLLEGATLDPQMLIDAFPDSLKILEIYEPQDHFKEIAFASYKIEIETDRSAAEIEQAFQSPLKVLKKTKRTEKEVLLSDFIRSIRAEESEGGKVILWATLAAGNEGSLSPNYLAEGLNNAEIPAKIKRVRRLAFYKQDGSEIR